MMARDVLAPSGRSWGERLIGVAMLTALLFAAAIVYLRDPTTQFVGFCVVRKLTGFYCPGCGLTRAVHMLLHGQISRALRMNAPMLILLFPAGYVVLVDALRRITGLNIPSIPLHPVAVIAIGILLLLFGTLRNLPIFSFLAPTNI